MKLCQANCFQHDAVGQHSISRTHTSDCRMLMDSPKESFPITGTPIREASATKILFVASEKQMSVKMEQEVPSLLLLPSKSFNSTAER